MSDEDSPIAGRAYAELISEQLQEERARKASLEQRGLAVISTSGVIVSLVFAVTAGLLDNAVLPPVGKLFVVAALAFFIGACVMGIATNIPRTYREVEPEGLKQLLERERWQSTLEVGRRRSAEARVGIYQSARSVTNTKARFLLLAIALEVSAVVFLAGAITAVILN